MTDILQKNENFSLDFTCFSTKIRAKLSAIDPKIVGIAFILCLFCAQECNGGTIKSAKNWKKIDWIRFVGIEKPIKNDSELWHFSGDDLVVDLYDVERENTVKSKRKACSDSAKARWEKQCDGNANAHANAYPTAHANAHANASQPRNAIAEVIREREEEEKSKNKIREREREHTTVVPDKGTTVPVPATMENSLSLKNSENDSPEPSPKNLVAWLRGLKVGLPDIDNCRVLPRNIDKAAHEAYNAIPDAPEKYGELLAAYYADKLTEDSIGKKFWRPSGTTFLENLTDIIHNHAVRWGKYTGWIKRHKKEHPPLVGDAGGQKTDKQYFFRKANIE